MNFNLEARQMRLVGVSFSCREFSDAVQFFSGQTGLVEMSQLLQIDEGLRWYL